MEIKVVKDATIGDIFYFVSEKGENIVTDKNGVFNEKKVLYVHFFEEGVAPVFSVINNDGKRVLVTSERKWILDDNKKPQFLDDNGKLLTPQAAPTQTAPNPSQPNNNQPSGRTPLPNETNVSHNSATVTETADPSLAKLGLQDQLTVTMRGVAGKGGTSSRIVEDLLFIQLTNAQAEILVPENFKRPFLRLLKTTSGIKKIPVINPTQRSIAVRKFASSNRIPIINNG